MKLLALIIASLLFCFCSYSAPIQVTDTKGRSMEVEIISHIPNTGMTKIKRSDGQVFNVNINVFDADSQKRIVANAPEPQADLSVKVSVGKRRKQQGNSSYMKDQTITASVKVENESRDIDFADGSGTLFLIARQTKRYADDNADYGKVLSKQVFRISTKADEETEYEAKPVVTSYDSDRDSSNVGGWEYYGYLFILEDHNKEIKDVVTSIGNLKKDVESDTTLAKKLLGLSQESIVKKNLEKR